VLSDGANALSAEGHTAITTIPSNTMVATVEKIAPATHAVNADRDVTRFRDWLLI
jgi:hypothetical protein